MMYLSLFVIACVIQGYVAPGGHSKICRDCAHVSDPADCMTFMVCHEESCSVDVHLFNGTYSLSYGCLPHHECEKAAQAFGKRQPGPHEHHHEHGLLVCRECCQNTGCDASMCESYVKKTTTMAPATTTMAATTMAASTMAPTDGVDPNCRDYESETFRCSELAKYNFCTDTTSVAYAIAHEKCAKYCGFCNPFGTVGTTMPPAATATMMTTTTAAATDPTATTASGPVSVDITFTNEPQTTTSGNMGTVTLCVDLEDSNFSCADWKSFGFCSPNSGVGYEVARLRCQKSCGFCS